MPYSVTLLCAWALVAIAAPDAAKANARAAGSGRRLSEGFLLFMRSVPLRVVVVATRSLRGGCKAGAATLRNARQAGNERFLRRLGGARNFAKRRSRQVRRERFPPTRGVCYNSRPAGEMDERFKSHAWKAC